VPLEEGRYTIAAEQVEPLVDERTIAVAGVLGTTFTGQMDDLESINELLARIDQSAGCAFRCTSTPPAAASSFPSPSQTCAGFPPLARPLDQRVKPQVRTGLPRHGYRRLPRQAPIYLRSSSSTSTTSAATCQLPLNFSRPSNSVVLQYFILPAPGLRGLQRDRRQRARKRPVRCAGDEAAGHRRARADQRRLDLLRLSCCAHRTGDADRHQAFALLAAARYEAGSCPRTPCRPTPITSASCAWWSRRTISRD